MPRLYNIKVTLVIPNTYYRYEGWLMADDEGTKQVLTLDEAMVFVRMTAERDEFREVSVDPAKVTSQRRAVGAV